MKRHFKLALGLTIIALTLIAIPNAFATYPLIGNTKQSAPFESRPSAVSAGSRTIATAAAAWDGIVYTLTSTQWVQTLYGGASPFKWGVTGFKRPSDVGRTDFAIGSVTIHIQYAASWTGLGTDDKYRIVYVVGGETFVLSDWMGSPATASTTNYAVALPTPNQISRSWGEVNGGTGGWDWGKISTLEVNFEMQLAATSDNKPIRIYEIWLTVYPLAPPISGSTVSVQPMAIEKMPAEDGFGIGTFFVDIYAHNMVSGTNGLQIAEFTLTFDPTVLQVFEDIWNFTEPAGTYVYWPWTTQNWFTYDNAGGQVSASLGIDLGNILVDYGLQGSFPIARIYFYVLNAAGSSPLHLSVSTMVAPGGIYIQNTPYDGVYGALPEFPMGLAAVMLTAPLISIAFLWRLRKRKVR